MSRPEEVEESLRYDFTDQELLVLGRAMAHEKGCASDLVEEKKETTRLLNEQIEKHDAEVARLAGLIRNGYEYRWIRCKVLYHEPNVGEKTIVRLDTGEIVRTVPVTMEERQEEIPLLQVAEKVAEEVNSGALDTDKTTVRMEIKD